MVFQWFPMVANHWSDDGMVTIHRSGLLSGHRPYSDIWSEKLETSNKIQEKMDNLQTAKNYELELLSIMSLMYDAYFDPIDHFYH